MHCSLSLGIFPRGFGGVAEEDSPRRAPRRADRGICAAGFLAILLCAPASGQDFRTIDRFAGGSNGDGGPALSASMEPVGSDVDAAGNVYVADSFSNSVRRIDAATGVITLIAGSGGEGATGDNGPASEATLRGPSDVAVDSSGNVFIVDRGNHKVRRVDAGTGIITTVAGNGTAGFSGDGGLATSASLNNPTSIALDGKGGFFLSDTTNDRIRQVFAGGGIRTYAGNGAPGSTGDGGPATSAKLGRPWGIGLDDQGNLYFAELLNQRIRVVYGADETIDTFAGSGQFAFCDEVPRLQACFKNPTSVAYDSAQDALFLTDTGNNRIRRIPLGGGVVTTVAGGTGSGGFPFGFEGDGGPAVASKLNGPTGISVHPALGIYFADELNFRIRQIFPDDTIDTIAGNGNLPAGGDGGPALSSKLNGPSAMATDTLGNLYIADTQNHRIRVVDSSGIIITTAGTGATDFNGDNIDAAKANLNSPAGIAVDESGNTYIADTSHNRVRRVAPGGTITTILGDGTASSTGDGGAASNATTLRPQGLAYWQNAGGSQKYLYIVEPLGQIVRRIDLNSNIVTRFAGNGQRGYSGDGGAAPSAMLSLPLDVATDASGNVYIADAGNHRIRKVSNGTISTAAGNGKLAFSGDGGLAISASLAIPDNVTVGPLGNIFINDSANLRIRVVTLDGNIQTAAGTGVQTGDIDGEGGNPLDDLGDGGPSVLASFSQPQAVVLDPGGNAYIADSQADTIRWVKDMSSLFTAAPQNAVFGRIRHATTLQAISGVSVALQGPTSVPPVSTSATGDYGVTGLTGSTWLVEPSKQGGFGANAISALDASYVLQFLVNSRNLSTAQQLACDVTGDGGLSPLDATHILQRSLESPPFANPFAAAAACGSDWLFIPNASPALNQTELSPLLQGGNTCRMGAIQFNPLTGQPDGQDFQAVVIGDCTGNWNGGGITSALASLSGRVESKPTSVVLGPLRHNRKRLRIPVSVRGDGGFNALDLRLRYDPAGLRPIKPRTRGDANGALVSWRETSPGELAVVVASGHRIGTPARAILVFDFEVLSDTAKLAISGASARIDEAPVGVSITRRRDRHRRRHRRQP